MDKIFRNFLSGASQMLDTDDTLLNKRFFEQNFKKILIVIILLLSYISLRYKYEESLANIGHLKSERNEARYTSIEKWSILTRRNRPELIRHKVANSSVHLIESDERPVEIN